MNELFAADPEIFQDSKDLRLFLREFGPFAGRYIAQYPNNWSTRTQSALQHLSDIDRSRVTQALANAIRDKKLYRDPSLKFDPQEAWIDNALRYASPPTKRFFDVFARSEHCKVLEDIDLMPRTTGQHIIPTPANYVKACETIIRIHSDLYLVDPYLDPCKNDKKSVLTEILKIVADRTEGHVFIFSRSENGNCSTEGEVRGALSAIRRKTRLPQRVRLTFQRFCNEYASRQMHARYIFGAYGGVRLDRGFQELKYKVEIGPIDEGNLAELLVDYRDGNHKNKMSIELDVTV